MSCKPLASQLTNFSHFPVRNPQNQSSQTQVHPQGRGTCNSPPLMQQRWSSLQLIQPNLTEQASAEPRPALGGRLNIVKHSRKPSGRFFPVNVKVMPSVAGRGSRGIVSDPSQVCMSVGHSLNSVSPGETSTEQVLADCPTCPLS